MQIFEKRLDDKLRAVKDDILKDYAEIFDHKKPCYEYDRQSSGQITERSDLFLLN